jgi:hypothetical protein
MTQRFVCQSCGRGLRVPEGCTEPLLTCPHCLAEVANPAASPMASQDIQAELPSPAPGSGAIQTSPLPSLGVGVDLDVRRDQHRTGCGIRLLAALGGLGLVYGLVGTAIAANEGEFWPLLALLAFLVLVGGISTLRVYRRPQPPTGTQGAGQVLLRTLTVLGVVVGAGCLLAGAAVIYLFVLCFSGNLRI